MLFILIEVIMKYYLVINISSPPELFKDLSEKVHVKKRRLFQADFRSIIVCDWNKKSHLCDIIHCEIWRDTNGTDHLHQYLINSPQNYQFIKKHLFTHFLAIATDGVISYYHIVICDICDKKEII